MAGSTGIHTTTLTDGVMNINAVDNVQQLSIKVVSGTVKFKGNVTFQGTASTNLDLVTGDGITLQAKIPGTPLDGITITATTGSDSCDLVLTMQ